MRALWILAIIGCLGGLYSLRQRHEQVAGAPSQERIAVEDMLPDDPRLHTGERRIVMLAAEWCGYCRKQRQDFEQANVRYALLDVDTPEGQRAARALGTSGVPVTVIGQDVVRGYRPDELKEKLAPLGYRL